MVTEIWDPSKFEAQHHCSSKLGLSLKYVTQICYPCHKVASTSAPNLSTLKYYNLVGKVTALLVRDFSSNLFVINGGCDDTSKSSAQYHDNFKLC